MAIELSAPRTPIEWGTFAALVTVLLTVLMSLDSGGLLGALATAVLVALPVVVGAFVLVSLWRLTAGTSA
ncbi:MAG: hypothetical protein QXG03_00050 [Halalkalicoccus sp.]